MTVVPTLYWKFSMLLFETDALDPFSVLNGNRGFASDAKVTSAASSFYRFLMAAGAIGVLASVIFFGLSLALKKDPHARAESKRAFVVKLVISVILSGFTSILGIALSIIEQI